MRKKHTIPGIPIRISFGVEDVRAAREILTHLTEERLVAGGTLVQAEALNWVCGETEKRLRREMTAYTTMDKVPLIRKRLEILTDGDPPPLSTFVMTDENQSVMHWIERNVRR